MLRTDDTAAPVAASGLSDSAASNAAVDGSQDTGPKSIIWLLAGLILAKVTFVIVYAFRSRWSMGEFGGPYQTNHLTEGLYTNYHTVKTSLPMLVFRIPLELSESATQILTWWRAETLAAAIVVIILTAVAARRLHGSLTSILLSVYTLLCFSNFAERSFRVRHDSFAVAFAMAALAVLVGNGMAKRRAWISGLLAGLAFLCTQKTVYWIAALGLALILSEWRPRGLRTVTGLALRFGVGWAIPVLAYALAFGGLQFLDVVSQVFLNPLNRNLLTAQPSSHGFIRSTLLRNPAALIACGVGLVLAASHWRRLDRKWKAAAIATMLVTTAVFLHPQPWPYVFVMALPALALWAPLSLDVFPANRRTFWTLVLVALLSWSFARNIDYLRENKAQQFEVVASAESLLAPQDRYFDGLGMVPNRRVAGRNWWWHRPTRVDLRERWEAGDTTDIDEILADRPKVWILNYRIRDLEPLLSPIWERSTVQVSPYLRLSGLQLDPDFDNEFHNYWPGRYRLFDRAGGSVGSSLTVDGEPCPQPCRIEAGVHRLNTDREAFLLPEDFRWMAPLPVEGYGRMLFVWIYYL